MSPGDRELTVVNALEDKRQRHRIALLVGVAIVVSLILWRQPEIAGLPGVLWAGVVMVGALLLARPGPIIQRGRALFQLGTIRKDGLAATAKLNAGDFQGAQEAYGRLLFVARPLGGFHAVHVLMFGVTRFFQGATKEGLLLASRALDSGWFDLRHTREIKDLAETWRVLMLLEAGELAEARRRVDSSGVLVTGTLAVSAYEEKWEAVFEGAQGALADPKFPVTGRPTIAILGRHAARQLRRDTAPFQKLLDAQKPGPLLLQNPALRRFQAEG